MTHTEKVELKNPAYSVEGKMVNGNISIVTDFTDKGFSIEQTAEEFYCYLETAKDVIRRYAGYRES